MLDLTFKISYSEKDFYKISELKLSDSILIKTGKIFFGKNVKGKIEAIIFPDTYLVCGKEKEIDYVYIRFYPDWCNEYLIPAISKPEGYLDEDLLSEAKNIHEENFKSYMHLNEYPIVREDYVPIVIKNKDSDQKERISYSL
jgi:hypothetical protein